MNFLFLGDIVGRAGRNIVIEKLKDLIDQYEMPDFVIANGENSTRVMVLLKKFVIIYLMQELMSLHPEITYGIKETMNHIIKENRLQDLWIFKKEHQDVDLKFLKKKVLKLAWWISWVMLYEKMWRSFSIRRRANKKN